MKNIIYIIILISVVGISKSWSQQNIPFLNYQIYETQNKLNLQFILPDTIGEFRNWGEFKFAYYPNYKLVEENDVYPNQNMINRQISISDVNEGFYNLSEDGYVTTKVFFDIYQGDDFVSDQYDAALLVSSGSSVAIYYDNSNSTGKVILSTANYFWKQTFQFGGIAHVSDIVALNLSSQATLNGDNALAIKFNLPDYNNSFNYNEIIVMQWDQTNQNWEMYDEQPLIDPETQYAYFDIDETGIFSLFQVKDYHMVSKMQDTARYTQTKQISAGELIHNSLIDTAAVQICQAKESITLTPSFWAVKTSNFTAQIVNNYGTINARLTSNNIAIDSELEKKLNEDRNYEVFFYPNPVQTKLHVDLSGENITNNYIRIISLNGLVVYDSKLNSESSYIDVSQLSKGIYIVNIYKDGKIIKKNKILKL